MMQMSSSETTWDVQDQFPFSSVQVQ
jgi:hypothetical protein